MSKKIKKTRLRSKGRVSQDVLTDALNLMAFTSSTVVRETESTHGKRLSSRLMNYQMTKSDASCIQYLRGICLWALAFGLEPTTFNLVLFSNCMYVCTEE